MTMMRQLMQLVESTVGTGKATGMTDAVTHHTSGMGDSLEGTFLNPDMMLQYFPSVQDKHAFNRAWRKVVRNQEERMTRLEMFEIARAFCDILRMQDTDKLSFMRRIMNVGPGSDIGPDETANTVYR